MREPNDINPQNIFFISDYKSKVIDQPGGQSKNTAAGELEAKWQEMQATVENFIVGKGFHIVYARETAQSIIEEAKFFRHFLSNKLSKTFTEEQIADAQRALVTMRAFAATNTAPKK